jgi:hypothetical protein
MASADFCSITRGIALKDALPVCGRVLWHIQAFRVWAAFRLPNCNDTNRMPVEQISPDRNANFHDATAAFTVSPESRPGHVVLYLVRIRSCVLLGHSEFRQAPK